jgi:hypothetical protein
VFYHLYIKAKKLWEHKVEGDMSPVVAEVQLVSPAVVTPRHRGDDVSHIASVYAIEQVTPSPKKKKRGGNSVTPVLPFATHVSDHVPVAEEDV